MELFANLTHFKDLASFNSIKNVKQALIDTVQKLEIFDVDDINEQLGRGNKDALELLDKHHIPYTLAQRENGYTVKYSYNGTNYTISYYTPQSIGNPEDTTPEAPDSTPGTPSAETPTTETPTTPAKPDNDTSVDEPETDVEVPPETPTEETPEVDETEKTEEAAGVEETEEAPTDPRFDYSVVGNLDTPIVDLYDENDINDTYKSPIANNAKFSVDFGGYDDVMQEIAKIKPQLSDYIKQKLEELGYSDSYNEDVIDKYLNAFITQAVGNALRHTLANDLMGEFMLESSVLISTQPNYLTSPNYEITTKDVINYVIELVDRQMAFLEPVPEAPEGQDKFVTTILRIPFPDGYIESGAYVTETADCFLSEDELVLKKAMLAVENEDTSYFVDKDEAKQLVDAYSSHMEWVLKSKYPFIAEFHSEILSEAKNTALNNMEAHKLDGSERYIIDDILKEYEAKCIELADKKNKEKYA